MTSLKVLAQKYRQFFIKRYRNAHDTVEFYHLLDGSPDELTQLVYECHGGISPDDFKYEFIVEALDYIASDDYEEGEYLEADIEDYRLLNWLNSPYSREHYVDKYVEEFLEGKVEKFNLISLIANGQWLEKQEILEAVVTFLEDKLDIKE